MAVRPSFGDKVNGIVRFIEDPCVAPWKVYIELAREPAKGALLAWFTFGFDDIMRGYFRPKGVRGRRHGRGKGKGGARAGRLGRSLARIPGIGDDIGNFIGKRIIGAKTTNQRHVTQGVKNMWFVDGVLQRGLWWWLVIGITTDFLYEWTSLLQETSFCKRTNQNGVYATGVTAGISAIQGWQSLLGMIQQSSHGNASWSGAAATLGPGRWTIIYDQQLEQTGNPGPSAHECRLVNAFGGGVLGESGVSTVELGGVSTAIAIADVQGPMTVVVEARISFGSALGKTADLWATGD